MSWNRNIQITMTTASASQPSLYTAVGHQLVVEIYVASLERSIDFYKSLGFTLNWSDPGDFAQLSWEQSLLFLKVNNYEGKNSAISPANVRIMVNNVDEKYEQCKSLGYVIHDEIDDRDYGLRDFIVLDPDGFGIRFGKYLKKSKNE